MLLNCFHFGSGMITGAQKDGNAEFDDENQNFDTVSSGRSN